MTKFEKSSLSLRELVNGYDFAEVVAKYWQALEQGQRRPKVCGPAMVAG